MSVVLSGLSIILSKLSMEWRSKLDATVDIIGEGLHSSLSSLLKTPPKAGLYLKLAKSELFILRCCQGHTSVNSE